MSYDRNQEPDASRSPERFEPDPEKELCEECSEYNDEYVIICKRCINGIWDMTENKNKQIQTAYDQLDLMKMMKERVMGKIAEVILWTNGMVMVFDVDGKQIHYLQGYFNDVHDIILAAVNPDTKYFFGKWHETKIEVTFDQWTSNKWAAHQ